MRPARDKAWVTTSAARLQILISQALPPLAAHPRTAVRTALAQGQILAHLLPNDVTQLCRWGTPETGAAQMNTLCATD